MKIINKKALHNYHILESFEAGIELKGAEVKSIRSGRANLSESYARIINNEAFLLNAQIPRYQNAGRAEYNPTRIRKLLLHKHQIKSLIGKLSATGATLVPVALYDKNNLIKIQLGLAKSKKKFDKRRVIKERDHARKVEQELRGKE